MTVEVVRLAMWSGPRNISTAMMRAWENRPDALVVDEPLYGYYLAATGLDHPAAAAVQRAQSTDWRVVVDELCRPLEAGVGVYFQKHMTHHLLPEVGRDWLGSHQHCLLIREPGEVVASYVRSRPTVLMDDIGIVQQVELYRDLAVRSEEPPLIIDAGDFLTAPGAYLEHLCVELHLPFYPQMLSWPPGPRSTDGVWAPHWYDNVLQSTGFMEPRLGDTVIPARLEPLVREAREYYDWLHERRLIVDR